MRRWLILVLAAACVFVVAAAIMIKLMPTPLKDSDLPVDRLGVDAGRVVSAVSGAGFDHAQVARRVLQAAQEASVTSGVSAPSRSRLPYLAARTCTCL